MASYPHTIENGNGESLTFLGVRDTADGPTLDLRNEVQPDCGPPMHVHFHQEEALTVQQGQLGYQIQGEPEKFAGPGETVVFAPGTPHRFWAAGGEVLRCTGYARPPHNLEYFLSQVYASTKREGGDKPNDFDAAFLMGHFESEFDMLDLPAPVKRVVFPVLRALGALTGRFRKYAGAPRPVG